MRRCEAAHEGRADDLRAMLLPPRGLLCVACSPAGPADMTASALDAAIDYNADSDPEEFAEPEPLTVHTLCDALGVSRTFIKKLAAVDDRERGAVAAGAIPMQRMVQVLHRMTASVAEVYYY